MNGINHDSFFEVFMWNHSLDTGYASIDSEHKQIIKILNDVANTLNSPIERPIDDILNQVAGYAEMHFHSEESVWIKYLGEDDEWVLKHRDNHNQFLPQVAEIRNSCLDKPKREVLEEIIIFLIRWLAFHIINSDKRLAFVVTGIQNGFSIEEAKQKAEEMMSGQAQVLTETILKMYEGLSSRTLDLLRERNLRMKLETDLRDANNMLEELALIDHLTKLYNRHHLDAVFETEKNRAQRNGLLLTYYIIDVDHFKLFNDTYGHVAGDSALNQVAQCLKRCCRRQTDFIFRIGGEEFSIITTYTNCEDAIKFGEYIRSSIEENIMCIGFTDTTTVTASVGGYCRTPTPDSTLKEYMDLSDKELYKAKDAGRNKFMMCTEQVSGVKLYD